MSNSDFLKKMREEGEKHSADNEFLNVARMIIKFGYSGFLAGHRPSEFFKPIGTHEDSARVSNEVSERLKELNSKRDAVFAIMFNIPKDTNTSEKVDWDIEQIIFEDQKVDSEYNLFFDTLNEGNFPVNEWFWGSYKNVPTGEYEKNGETKKRYTSLPVEKFPDETTAMATVDGGSVAKSDTQWSDKVRANDDVYRLESSVEEIQEAYNTIKSTNKKPWEGAIDLPKFEGEKIPTPLIKQYLSHKDMYACESSDIDIVLNMTPPVPF